MIVRCRDCRFWAEGRYEYMGCRPCYSSSDLFFVGGGDENDSLFTAPGFGCVAGLLREAEAGEEQGERVGAASGAVTGNDSTVTHAKVPITLTGEAAGGEDKEEE